MHAEAGRAERKQSSEEGCHKSDQASTFAANPFDQPTGVLPQPGRADPVDGQFVLHLPRRGDGQRVEGLQDAVPGQEILLYSEPGPPFGDIVFAEVGGAFFGYFFAQQEGGTIAIRRVPLTGGGATVLATVTDIDIANSHRNLVTDGANLYWQDVQSVRKMPIGGGVITVLDEASPNTPTAGLALQNGNLIYASVADIRYVPLGGATTLPSTRTIVAGAERVTALHAVLNFIYWGEESGAIRVILANGSSAETISTIAGFIPTSIATSTHGGVYAQAWTQCDAQSCRLHFDVPSGEELAVHDRRKCARRRHSGVGEHVLGRCGRYPSPHPAVTAGKPVAGLQMQRMAGRWATWARSPGDADSRARGGFQRTV